MSTTMRFAAPLSLALLCTLAIGCGRGPDTEPAADAASGGGSFIGRQAASAIAEASRKLEAENIRVGRTHINIGQHGYYGSDRSSEELPRAEITPQGDFLVEGETVPVTAAQRELLLDHRRHLIGLAQTGMAIGAQGADIAGTALTGIGGALFGGEEGRKAYEQRIEAEAEKIKDEALRLCALLPELHASQQALAASLPAFAPYATLQPGDFEDCGKDMGKEGEGVLAAVSRLPN